MFFMRSLNAIYSRRYIPQFPSTLIHNRNIRTQPAYSTILPGDREGTRTSRGPGLATPRQLVEYLNEFIIGQENAKRVLSVAVYNHFTRVQASLSQMEEEYYYQQEFDRSTADATVAGISSANLRPGRRSPGVPFTARRHLPLFEKSNVLVIGPTGSGKTLLAKTLAKVLDVPFSVSDATSFTQAGYVGEDVDMAIQRLLQAANWDPLRASMGIVYIDEVDKIARKSSSGIESSRDVGGEGVQQALLRMMEGSIVAVQAKGAASAVGSSIPGAGFGGGAPGSVGGGAGDMGGVGLGGMGPDIHSRTGQRAPHLAAPAPKPDVYHVDTTNVLFILSGAFVGLDQIIKQRVAKGSIGFTANLGLGFGNSATANNSETEAKSGGVSRGSSLPFFTSSAPKKAPVPQDVLKLIETEDLVKYGLIPEFISRLPSVTTLSPLTISDLRKILTDVQGSLVSQYQALFKCSGVDLRFTDAALDEICKKAYKRGGGARGLRGIMESLLLDPMYEVPGSDVRYVLITSPVVRGEEQPLYWKENQGVEFWQTWATEESQFSASLVAPPSADSGSGPNSNSGSKKSI